MTPQSADPFHGTAAFYKNSQGQSNLISRPILPAATGFLALSGEMGG